MALAAILAGLAGFDGGGSVVAMVVAGRSVVLSGGVAIVAGGDSVGSVI